MEDKKYSKIIKKIKGLLAIAKDENQDEESQSAFVLAQRLMLQYKIDKNDVFDTEDEIEPIGEESVTIYKKLYWWERSLGSIIAENFRVKMFYNSKKKKGERKSKSKIVFYGFGSDLELAKEMYFLAYEVIVFHTNQYIKNWYQDNDMKRSRYITESVKSSYISGFLVGLQKRFEEQISVLAERYEVMVLIPKAVEESFDKYSKDFSSYSTNTPPVSVDHAYQEGVREAKKIDLTKSTVDTDYSSLVGRIIRFNQGVTRGLIAEIISVSDDLLNLLVMNCVSEYASEDNPSFYHWEVDKEYDYEILSFNDPMSKKFKKNKVDIMEN
ncbi:DUF2786 domain-containing protein [Enterococcus faecium]|uniref:DUF2786 domain-containing protein n=1 Tax=Enterococcus faecium TaxID=1352 RepID=UPI001261A720|nr:DUF2786 domain-containing protein [Enterococcus faecium]KAB7597361.1 DUF2786 domain-containing protein [Enterococcus faecium]HAP6323888.1 DUF2786 domain-containing protein [Enterococcus faecium]